MQRITDYQIVQRDDNGNANVRFGGALPANFTEKHVIYACAFREDDGLPLCAWQKCEAFASDWETTLTLPEGGLYRLEARYRDDENGYVEWSPRIACVRHIGVGELYVLTGQSNMAGYGRDMAYDPPELGVHLYANDGRWIVAAHPLNDSTNTIYPENREEASSSSPALAFGRMMKKRLGVPVGLVQASLGGSSLAMWHPEEDGKLTRGMMRRISVVGRVGGIIWYQGCSDANPNDSEHYLERFARTVELWREALGDVPVVTVQLNRWAAGGKPTTVEQDRYWGEIRDAQRRAEYAIDKLVTVPTHDLPLSDGIHNGSSSNVAIGERMANAALKAFYGLPGILAPNVRRIEREDDTHARLIFDAQFTMRTLDDSACDFHVEDESGLIPCLSLKATKYGLLAETERPFGKGAHMHAIWRCSTPSFQPRDLHGMPVLAFYNVPIED